MSGTRILFVANAGPEVGGGHVMRCLTLARALNDRGADCNFLATPEVAEILNVFGPEMPREAVTSLTASGLADALTGVRFNAIVFDHYGLDRGQQDAMSRGRPVLVIDDLANRPLGADIVLDSGPARRMSDYGLLVEGHTQLLLGPAYAPVRPEFAEQRAEALAHRDGPVRRILVSLGLTDLGGITGRVLDRLRPRLAAGMAVDVVVGSGAAGLAGLKRLASRDPRLSLHIDSQDMARLTAEADVALGAAGSTTWERCVLGLPSALVVLADNQKEAAAAMAAAGAAIILDANSPEFEPSLDRALVHLLNDGALRRKLSEASAGICDGQGAWRTAEVLLDLIQQRDSLPQLGGLQP